MALRLSSNAADFDAALTALLEREREQRTGADDVARVVSDIIAEVRAKGDAALASLTEKFDRFSVDARGLQFTSAEIDAAVEKCDRQYLDALELAAARIETYHRKQLPEDVEWVDEAGVTLGWRWTPLDSVGIYVPGGLASYPSSVLMNAVPAKVAGVARVAMVVPTPDGEINPLVLAAAKLAGVTEIYRIGGAQAVAALAYGADTVAPVDKIIGPGNAFVAEAKRQVFGKVGIDTIAGPSEILVVADDQNDPEWTAADLLSQAEHDAAAQSILITDSADFADRVDHAVEGQLKGHPREEIACAAWENNSAIIVVPDLEADAPAIVNKIAPEHLELAVEDPKRLMKGVRHAGAIFLGRHSPEAVGDYVAGPDHVLPTSQVARYAAGLSTFDFIKRSSIIGCDPTALEKIGPAAASLADSEGLFSHANSIRVRLKK